MSNPKSHPPASGDKHPDPSAGKPNTPDPGSNPGRFDPMQSTGGDPPLTRGDKGSGALPSQSLAAGATVTDVIAHTRAFMAAIKARDVAGAARESAILLSIFSETFGTPPVAASAAVLGMSTELAACEAEFAAFKGDEHGKIRDFRNPSFYGQGGASSGSAPGMAKTGHSAAVGIDPTTIAVLMELVGKLFEWFKSRG